jgi:clan AA aspartic protease
MGMIYATLDLFNSEDIMAARRHYIGEEEIRQMPVKMLVDTGSEYTCINETVKEQLGLPVLQSRKAYLANGGVVELEVVGPLEIRFGNRLTITSAMVLPGDCEMLLGAITIEDMDVVIDPHRRQLIVNPEHPYMAQLRL